MRSHEARSTSVPPKPELWGDSQHCPDPPVKTFCDNYKYYSSWGANRLQPSQPYYLRCSVHLWVCITVIQRSNFC